jgi:CubicO group peptidase (beta-lactamase class C family)
MTSPTVVSGHVEPQFEPLADVLGRLIAAQGRGGASVCIYQGGRRVVALTAGTYEWNDLQLVFSVSKLAVSLALHRAQARGLLDLGAPVASYWPQLGEDAANFSVDDVLAHRSPYPRLTRTLSAQALVAGGDLSALEEQQPNSHAGHAYHAVTYGSLLEGVVRHGLGTSLAELVRTQLSEPLGLQFYLGVPEAILDRVRPVVFEPPAQLERSGVPAFLPPDDHGLLSLLADPEVFNSPAFLQAGMPALGGVATAESLARLVASTVNAVDGIRLLTDAQRRVICAPRSSGLDGSLGVETVFGSGVQLPFPRLPWTGSNAFGHEGAGGSAAFADPDLDLAVGFTTDVFPASAGASPAFLALLPSIALLAGRAR